MPTASTIAASDNVFTENNFLSNTLDLVVDSKVNNNTFNGNYWSEYTGYDLDRDGVGDVPHRPVKLFSFILSRSPEAIVLLRSLFIDLINFSEKVSPVFTPANVLDERPLMKKWEMENRKSEIGSGKSEIASDKPSET